MSDIDSGNARFLYLTDLHGDSLAYAALPDLCAELGLRIIVQGGDICPKAATCLLLSASF